MIIRPRAEDIKIIGYYLGKIIIGLGIFTLVPLAFALIYQEFNPAFDFVLSFLFSMFVGLGLTYFCRTERDLKWIHGMVVVSLAWLVAAILGAIPFYLSNHFGSFLDAVFEAMSGFATTGLTLVQDLDHLSNSHNLWRHLLMFLGGQGIIVIALSFLVKGLPGAFRMYVGEARDEKVLPNIVQTARFIWLVSIVYMILGSLALAIVATLEGLAFPRALFHGVCVFMAAFDTGGFAPQSQNTAYYHSLAFEIVTIVIMFLGAMNFKLHYAIWTGNRREIWRNIEIVTFSITIVLTYILVVFGLKQLNTYTQPVVFFRKGFYHLISAHTGTGHSTLYAMQFVREWSNLALVGIIIAMGLGGGMCSTTGAIKSLRIGVIFKALIQDTKKIMLPESAVFVQRFHHIKQMILDDRQVRSAAIVTLLYIGLYFLGAIIGMFFKYPFLYSLFESTSAAANVGLSCGITQASMPTALKITYIFQMWAGRLEFLSIFTLIGFFVAYFRGK
ncbi:MAG: TrkH family potassium uptake protein [Candidatus Omnitrophota bacterium]